jgi:2-dehydro-3-deoxyphosphogluconate aldolase/(4S)-4-hydroxy-2-oxoglutarate aldolase
MKLFSSLMAGQKLLPIIQADTVEQGVNIAKAMSASGLTVVEVVLRTSVSLDALKAIKVACPELIVGAGTVVSEEILKDAVAAGADFIVTPAISTRLLSALEHCELPVLPGVSNTADILVAKEFGYKELKLFPASLSGGAAFINAMSSVFSELSFCPTGGVNQSNLHEYLSLKNVFGAGGTWMVKKEWLENKDWQAITKACEVAQA